MLHSACTADGNHMLLRRTFCRQILHLRASTRVLTSISQDCDMDSCLRPPSQDPGRSVSATILLSSSLPSRQINSPPLRRGFCVIQRSGCGVARLPSQRNCHCSRDAVSRCDINIAGCPSISAMLSHSVTRGSPCLLPFALLLTWAAFPMSQRAMHGIFTSSLCRNPLQINVVHVVTARNCP